MRLTNEVRNTILARLIYHRLKKPVAALDKLAAKVGPAIYKKMVPAAPKGVDLSKWARMSNTIIVEASYRRVQNQDILTYPELQPVMSKDQRNFKSFKFSMTETLPFHVEKFHSPRWYIEEVEEIPAVKAWINAIDEVQTLRRKITEEVRPLLLGSTTVAALLKNWPEVEPFIPKIAAQVRKSTELVPVEKINAVNALVQIPVK